MKHVHMLAGLLPLLVATVLLPACTQRDVGSILAAADAALIAEDYRTAIIEYRNAIDADDSLAASYLGLARAYLGAGDPAQALVELNRIDLNDSGLGDRVTIERARAHLKLGEYNKTIDLLGALPGSNSDVVGDSQMLLAEAALHLGNHAQAMDIFDQVTEAQVDLYVRALLGRAAIASANENIDGAMTLLDQAVRLDSTNIDALTMRSAIFVQRNQLQSAAADLSDLSAEAFRKGNRPAHADALNRLVTIWILADEIEKARDVLTEIRQAYPGGVLEFRANALLLVAEGNPGGAFTEAQKALALNPNSVALLLDAAKIGLAAGQSAQAEQYARRAASLDQNSDTPLQLLANAYISQGRFADADRILAQLGPAAGNELQRHLIRGFAALSEGDYDQSIQYLKSVLENDPNNFAARSGLARAYALAGRFDDASKHLSELFGEPENTAQFDTTMQILTDLAHGNNERAEQEALELTRQFPTDRQSWLALGIVYKTAGDFASAESAINRAIEITPGFEPAYRLRAAIRQLRGDTSGAVADLEQVAMNNPTDVSIAIQRAQILAENGNVAAAIASVEEFIKHSPDSAPAWFALARLQLQNGDMDSARKAATRTEELDPSNPRANLIKAQMDLAEGRSELALRNLTGLATRYPKNIDVLKALGRLHLLMGNPEKAHATFSAAARLSRSDESVTTLLCESSIQGGRVQEAMACASSLAIAAPNDANTHSMNGRALMLGEQYSDAANSFRIAYDLSGSRSDLIFLVRSQLAAGIGEPEQLMRTWLSNTPDDDGIRLILADLYSRFDEPEKAVIEYEKILRQSPQNVVAANNLAWLIRDTEPDRAERIAIDAAALAPDSVGILDTAGWILLNNGKTSAAVRYLRQAAELSSNNPEVLYHLAVAIEKDGAPESAAVILRQALEINRPFASRTDAETLLRAITARKGDDGA